MGGPRRKGQLPALSTPGATCARLRGGRRASHEAVAWLAAAPLFTSWEGKQEEVPGSLRAQPGLSPAGLLGNQESQAQLIKLWPRLRSREAASRTCGSRPLHRALPQAGPVRSISPLPSHWSSASTHSSRPAPTQAPTDQEDVGGIKESGNSREGPSEGQGLSRQRPQGTQDPLGCLITSLEKKHNPPK